MTKNLTLVVVLMMVLLCGATRSAVCAVPVTEEIEVGYSTSSVVAIGSSTYVLIAGTSTTKSITIQSHPLNTGKMTLSSNNNGMGLILSPGDALTLDNYYGNVYLITEAPYISSACIFRRMTKPWGMAR